MDNQFRDFNITFADLNISPKILAVLDANGFRNPSFIQAKAIPPAIEKNDIIGIAQTGTGKTLAFTIPIMHHLAHDQGRALILCPTRELAVQIQNTIKTIGQPLDFYSALLIGGDSFDEQLQQLNSNARILIATPGRLLDHLRQQTTRLDDVNLIVLDEADRMLDMGFIPSVELIFKYIAKERLTMMFSATMPDAIARLADTHMKNPLRIQITPPSTAATTITQEMYLVSPQNKILLLEKLLSQIDRQTSVLIFCRRKIDAAQLYRKLKQKNYKTAEIHADKTQEQRFMALNAFKKGLIRILVATDVAARGLDIDHIGLVINFDLPDDPSNYVHRIGRTGRAGKLGHAISFATPVQAALVKDIEKSIGTALSPLCHPDLPQEYFVNPKKIMSIQRKKRVNRQRK